MSGELSHNKKLLIRAAFSIAPDGEPFDFNDLDIPGMSDEVKRATLNLVLQALPDRLIEPAFGHGNRFSGGQGFRLTNHGKDKGHDLHAQEQAENAKQAAESERLQGERMDELTDDMKALLKAAPRGEIFFVEDLKLRGIDTETRRAAARSLQRDWKLWNTAFEYEADAGGERSPIKNPKGIPYIANDYGNLQSRQLVADDANRRATKRWKVIAAILGGG
jgi:hypothetical protein